MYKLDKYLQLTKFTRTLQEHRKNISDFVANVVKDYEKAFDDGLQVDKESSSFLDHFYRLRHTMSYDECNEHIVMFLEAAFDTTGKGISSTLLLLAMNQEVQDKAVAEILSVLDSEDDEIDFEKLNQLNYLDLVIKEALRMMPQAIVHMRENEKDIKLSIKLKLLSKL